MVRHRLLGGETVSHAPEELSGLCCQLESLPLPNGSLDAMVLHHALEVSADPRSSLREAARVLAPGGRLVVCAFNAVSLWGLRAGLARFRDDAFTGLRLMTTYRLLDWLALLGFQLQDEVQYLAYGLPFAPGRGGDGGAGPGRLERGLQRLQPPIGGVYVVSMVKQAAALRPPWTPAPVKSPALIPAAYPKSAANHSRTAAPGNRAPVLQFSDWKDLERGR